MSVCKGLFGKWYGHEYESYLLKKRIPGHAGETKLYNPEHVIPYLEALRDHYEIRCKRCGGKPDDK